MKTESKKLKTIKFSHPYTKLLDEHNDVIEYAKLLDVRRVELATLDKKFIDYDTDHGLYKLPAEGSYLMLIFLKPPESFGTCAANLFTTFRRSSTEKDLYYHGAIGETFAVEIHIPEVAHGRD